MNILHIDCSPRTTSHSRMLSSVIVERLLAGRVGVTVRRRDLGLDPLPHVLADYAHALSSPAAFEASSSHDLRLSDELIGEVEAADVIVVGTPMNNFTVPSVLKAWLDQIVRIGRTLAATPAGKVGLLKDRPVYVAIASGGAFSGERANQPDFLTPYLDAVFGCIGLKTLHFVSIQATAFLDERQAHEAINALIPEVEAAIEASRPILGRLASASKMVARLE
jgi:FMN-dependent NADH-azoreductase